MNSTGIGTLDPVPSNVPMSVLAACASSESGVGLRRMNCDAYVGIALMAQLGTLSVPNHVALPSDSIPLGISTLCKTTTGLPGSWHGSTTGSERPGRCREILLN